MKAVKLEQDFIGRSIRQNQNPETDLVSHGRPETEKSRGLTILETQNSRPSVLDQERSPIDDSSFCSTSSICPAPICRQFWRAGNYDDRLNSKPTCQSNLLF